MGGRLGIVLKGKGRQVMREQAIEIKIAAQSKQRAVLHGAIWHCPQKPKVWTKRLGFILLGAGALIRHAMGGIPFDFNDKTAPIDYRHRNTR